LEKARKESAALAAIQERIALESTALEAAAATARIRAEIAAAEHSRNTY